MALWDGMNKAVLARITKILPDPRLEQKPHKEFSLP